MKRFLLILFGLITISSCIGKEAKLLQHPRLLFTSEEEIKVKNLIETNSEVKQLASFIKNKADSIISLPEIPYKMDKYGNMLHTSRAYVMRLGTLSLAYRLYGNNEYLDAVNRSLIWICNYKDWDPKHYLDTSEMTTAVAIAYDWLYDTLPQNTKDLVKKSIYKNALSIVVKEYEKGGSYSWAKRETNWNIVCNTGMVMGALAVAEDYPEEANNILANAPKYMPNCLKHFAPDGVCYEGPAYWGYTTSYLSLYLKAMDDNGGDNTGIGSLSGIPQTARYYINTHTPSGRLFNFGNASIGEPLNTPAFFLFSKRYNQPDVASWYRKLINETIKNNYQLHQLFFLSLAWIDLSETKTNEVYPKAKVYHNSINDLIVFNGDRKKKGSIFLVAKTGQPNQAHQQMDCGTFIVESDGVCWSEDLGSDDYALPGFWDYKPGGERWKYFRNNNLSHNTLNIDHKIQYADGKANIKEEKTEIKRPYVKIDLSSLYKDESHETSRKFTLIDDFTIETEDNVKLIDKDSDIFWNMVTKAEVETKGNTAILKKDGKKFYIKVVSPADAVFSSYKAKNTYQGEKKIEGYTVIEAKCKLNGNHCIKVRMSSEKL